MLNRVTFILAAVFALTLPAVTGCVKTYDPAPEPGSDAIRFDAGSSLLVDDALTRTEPLAGLSFGVFAYLQPGTALSPGAWTSSRTPNFMYNLEVDGSDYHYSPTRYWPSPENTVSFWAYCPYDSNASSFYSYSGGIYSQYSASSTGLPSVRFTVTDGHTDFLMSDLAESQTYASNSGTVTLNFNHTLSLIDFTVEKVDSGNDYEVILTDISFEDIYMSGICRGGTTWEGFTGGRRSITVLSGGTQEAIHNTRTAVTGASVMVIPQTVVGAASMKVTYTLEVRSTGAKSTNECYLDITNNWAANGHYTYYLQITPDLPIEFSVSWTDWGDAHNYHLGS